MLSDKLLALKNRLAHFDAQFFNLVTPGNDASIIIGEDDNRPGAQRCMKYSFAGDIEVIAIDQRIDFLSHTTL